MKCINKAFLLSLTVLSVFLFAGCRNKEFSMEFDRNMNSTSYSMVSIAEVNSTLTPYTESICVDFGEYPKNSEYLMAEAGGLFDMTGYDVVYGKNLYQSMNPASLTKIMTAYVALKYGNLGDRLTVSENAMITESGAQTAGLKVGDTMTLEQALNIMMVCSANDAAAAIAEHVGGGNIDVFVNAMNAEALRIGATGTHFTNPHGLTNEAHKTTPYDLYLIFNEALKDETFKTIIGQVAYSTNIYDAAGNPKEISVNSTNSFLRGDYEAPPEVAVLGGKTGTTAAAGSCLAIYAKDSANRYFVSVILNAPDRETSYTDTIALLQLHGS